MLDYRSVDTENDAIYLKPATHVPAGPSFLGHLFVKFRDDLLGGLPEVSPSPPCGI